ncbi:protein required for growth at high temperature [Scheffersomyces amazonensis]|uniref:protein required for growth at high temperature n=1 Tax=Scheffersomyces amazonensis TaxID=1078765 RepID=UPI00315D3149
MDNKSNALNTTCGVCNINPAKYKCPQCSIPYCSLICFKSESHQSNHKQTNQGNSISDKKNEIPISLNQSKHTEPEIVTDNSEFDEVLQDPIIQAMLQEKSLQFHLLTLIKLLKSPQELKLNNEIISNNDNRLSIMNHKLNDLRVGGIEENSLVEEFIQRVLTIYQNKSRN